MTKETKRALSAIIAFFVLVTVVTPCFSLPTFATEIKQTSTPSGSVSATLDSSSAFPSVLEAEQITSENAMFRHID